LFCSVLAGSNLEARLEGKEGKAPPSTGHFLGAIKLSGFREPSLIYAQIAQTLDMIRNSKKAPGHDRIFIPGEFEDMAEKENRQLGIPLTPAVLEQVRRLNQRFGLGFAF